MAGRYGTGKAKEQISTARLVEKPAAPMMLSTAQEVGDDPEMDDRTRSLIASTFICVPQQGIIKRGMGASDAPMPLPVWPR